MPVVQARDCSTPNTRREVMSAMEYYGNNSSGLSHSSEDSQTLDQVFEGAFGKDWQLQRPQSSLEQRMDAHKKNYVHYLLGRGEKGAVYHQLWFPGTSLSFSLEHCDPATGNNFSGDRTDGTTPTSGSTMYKLASSAPKGPAAKGNLLSVNDLRPSPSQTPNSTARPISAFSHREVKTLELDSDQYFTPQVFDPIKPPKTPRPMADVISRNRNKRIKQRNAVNTARELSNKNQDNFEITGYQTLLYNHHDSNEISPPKETEDTENIENLSQNESDACVPGDALRNNRPILLVDSEEVAEDANEEPLTKNDVTESLLEDENYQIPDDVSIDSPIAEETNLTPHFTNNEGSGVENLNNIEENKLQVEENCVTGLESDTSLCNFDEDALDVNTTFSSEQDACSIQVSNTTNIPQYKVEKYNITNILEVDSKKKDDPKFEEFINFRALPGEDDYDLISDEPWGFENYYSDFLPAHLANLDFDSLANVNKDWRFATGNILPSQEESSLLDRLLEISKYQVSTVKQEEEQKRPRYMRPRSSQLSQASSNYIQSGAPQETPIGPQRSTGNPVARARSALASLSSRYCTECKQTPCHEACRYYIQPVASKPTQVFKRCYLCRQMNCQSAQNCSQLKKIRATQSARTKKTSVPAKTTSNTARGSRLDSERPKHRSNSGLSTFESQKNLIKYCTDNQYNRPKSADVSSIGATHPQYITHRSPISEDVSSKFSMKQVNLSDDLAEFLETDEGFKNNYPPYLPKPPPGTRELMSLDQKVAALSLPVARLSKPKSALSTLCNDGKAVKGKSKSSEPFGGNSDADKNLVKLLVPRIALPCQPEPPSVYVSVYRSHNLTTHSGRLRGTKRFGGRLTAFT